MKYGGFGVFVFLFVICSWTSIPAQMSIVDEIAQQVWTAFKDSYGIKDAARFNAIHTDDVLRITARGILVGQAYRDQNIRSFARKDSPKRVIDFRFERRIHESNMAYEIGYYQISYDNDEEHYYGRFSVLLKKENGQWRIAQDWDTNDINGHKVGKADWDRLAVE